MPLRVQPSTVRKGAVGAAAVLTLAIPLVGGFEGFVNHVYSDAVGKATYCFGETQNPQPGKTYTIEECNALLGDRLAEFDAGVKKCVVRELPVKVEAAFDSLAYNIGIGAFCSSSVARKASAGDLAGACDAMLAFNKGRVGGRYVVLAGLDTRRHKERDLCREGLA